MLLKALGVGPITRHGNTVGLLGKKLSLNSPSAVSAIQSVHSDSGLVGVYIVRNSCLKGSQVADGSSVERAVKEARATLGNLSLNDAQFKAAKQQAKLVALRNTEETGAAAVEKAVSVLNGQALSFNLAATIDKVSNSSK